MNPLKQKYIDAKAKILDPANWTTGRLAKNEADFPVPYDSSEACKWCAMGACFKVGMDQSELQMLDKVCEKLYGREIVGTNDCAALGYKAILEAFDEVINALPD